MDEYFRSEPEAIESKLGSEPALRMHVLASVATGHVGKGEALLAFFNRTFYAYTGEVPKIQAKFREVLDFLAKEDFIHRQDGFLKPTFFGKRTSDLYIDPLTAVKMRDALREPRDDPIFHLWTICTTPDMPKLYLRRGDYAWVEQKIEEADFTFTVEDYDFFLSEMKTASLLDDWTAERTEEEVTFFFQAEDGIRDVAVTGVQTCALPISFPSNTARGGVLYPIVLSLAQNSGSMPDQKNRRMGGYLMFCGMASLSVSSALWLTATSGNPIAVSLAERYGVKINFGSWIVAASIPILTMIVLLPLMLYRLFPPGVTKTPDAPKAARDALRTMGRLTRDERIVAVSFARSEEHTSELQSRLHLVCR